MSNFDDVLDEAIAGLPDSIDPYAPAARTGEKKTEDAGLEDLGEETEAGGEDGLGGDLGGDLGGMSDLGSLGAPPEQNKPAWEPFELKNKKEIAFRREDGFKLRMYKLESVRNIWLAQLWLDDQIIDKGQIVVPNGVDPIGFIKGVADHMLDYRSRRYAPEVIGKDDPEPLEPLVGKPKNPPLDAGLGELDAGGLGAEVPSPEGGEDEMPGDELDLGDIELE